MRSASRFPRPHRPPHLQPSLALALGRAGRLASPRIGPENPYALRCLTPARPPRPALRAARQEAARQEAARQEAARQRRAA